MKILQVVDTFNVVTAGIVESCEEVNVTRK
jgi:hypothetical protein